MKIKTSIVTCLALAAGAALADVTTEINSSSLSVLKNSGTAATEKAIGVPWTGTDGSAVTVDKLIATGLSNGDQISVWDATLSGYYVWSYTDGSWVGAQRTDSKETPAASSYTVAAGRAVWYKPAATQGYTLAGKAASSYAVTAGTASVSLLADPFPADFSLSGLTGMKDGDRIVLMDENKTVYTYVTGKGWCTQSVAEKYGQSVTVYTAVAENTVIPAGTAIWYMNNTPGDVTLTWR